MSGFQPLSRALIIAWGHQLGNAHLALLNIRANQIRWVVYAFAGFEILLYPNPIGFTSLAAALIVAGSATWRRCSSANPAASVSLT